MVKPLNRKNLRRRFFDVVGTWPIVETLHTRNKHSGLSPAEVLYGMSVGWTEFKPIWKEMQWRYRIKTLASNEKWMVIVLILDERKKEIKIVTRYQNELDRYGKKIPTARPKARLSQAHNQKNIKR
jgi:hypothetical protein